jgi:hypothetical protein
LLCLWLALFFLRKIIVLVRQTVPGGLEEALVLVRIILRRLRI